MRRAGRTSLVGTAFAGLSAVVLVAPSPLVAVVGSGSVVALLGATLRDDRRLLTLAATALFGCVVVAAIRGVPTPFVLGATVATVLTYDLAENTVTLRRQVGKATTTRVELLHGTATATLAGGVSGVGYLLSVVAPTGLPSAALLGLLAGAVLLLVGLRG